MEPVARLRRNRKFSVSVVSLQCCAGFGQDKNPVYAGEESGKSWRAHREIKGYAGSCEHRIAANEREHAAGNGAADNPADTDEPNGTCPSTGCGYRYDRYTRAAAGSGADANPAAEPA